MDAPTQYSFSTTKLEIGRFHKVTLGELQKLSIKTNIIL
jgi:hypothetical protein